MANKEDEIGLLVSAAIQAKIIQAFHEAPEAIDKLVEAALGKEVNEHGHKPEYRDRSKMPYLEWLVGDTIRRVARAAIIEAVEEREDAIKEAVKKAVRADDLVVALTESILGTIGKAYALRIKFVDETEK